MKFLFFAFLVLLPLLASGQQGEAPEVSEEPDEEVLRELELNREQRQRALEALQDLGDDTLSPQDQLKRMGYGTIHPGALFNLEALEVMEKLIREARMWDVHPDTVRDEILKSMKGSTFGSLLKGSPRLLNFMVDFMRDKDALLNGIAIFKDRSRLKNYLYFWIGIMFAAYYMRRLFVSKFWKKPIRIFAGVLYSLTITVITFSTFCLIFEKEMRPIIALVKKHL